jgi:hypothetical protein
LVCRNERTPHSEIHNEKQRQEQWRRDGAFVSCVPSLTRRIRRHVEQNNTDAQ